MAINTATITFTPEEQKALKHVITSSAANEKTAILKLVDIGALRMEDAAVMVKTAPISQSFDEANHKIRCARKAALLEIAKDKADAEYENILTLHKQLREAYAVLEERYGSETTLNQGAVVGKVLTKLKTDVSPVAVTIAKSITEFQNKEFSKS
jgi:hypothetical protein